MTPAAGLSHTLDAVSARGLTAADLFTALDEKVQIIEWVSRKRFTPPAVSDGHVISRGGLHRFYDRNRTASVLVTGATAVQKEALSDLEMAAADLVYLGGRTYEVTDDEAQRLVAAGLTFDEDEGAAVVR